MFFIQVTMGYHVHHAVLVSSWFRPDIEKARQFANVDLRMQTTAIATSDFNGLYTFVVTPDGSKEGWEASNIADAAREALAQWLSDSSNGNFKWALVEYGDEAGKPAQVLSSSQYADAED